MPSANPVLPGASVTFTADLAGVSPTGTVNFLADGASLCTAAPVAPGGTTGRATCTTNALPVGDHTIVAVYSGDADDGPATSASLDFWVSTACRATSAPSLAMPAVTWLRSWRAELASPSRVAVDPDGNLLVADGGTGEVVARTAGGARSLRATGAARAVSVAAGAAGRIYVGDAATGRVRTYDAAGSWEFDFGSGPGEFGHPGDIAVDPAAGEVFVSDTDRHVIGVYDAATGTHKRTLGRYGRSDAQFHTPTGLVIDGAELLVADQLNYRVQSIDKSTGAFIYCLGTYSQGGFISGGGGPGRSYGMVQGLALDAAGRLYLADAFQGVVRVIDRAAATTLGTIGAFGNDGAQLRVPTDLAIDGNGRLFVAAADSGKLEVWGLGAYTDPESSTHAKATLVPSTHNRLQPPVTVRVLVELASVAPTAVDLASLRVNGLSPLSTAEGDADYNGQPDLALDVDAAALFATLGGTSSGPVVVAGLAGGLAFSAQASLTLTATPLPTVTTLAAPVETIIAGSPVTLTATIAGLTPTGTVHFANGATPLCTGVVVASGAAQCTTSALPAGFHGLTAAYGGDVDDAPSLSAPFDLLVLQAAPSVTLASSANPAPAGLPVTLTAEVAGLAPGGTVDFMEGDVALCNAVALVPLSATRARAQCETSALVIGPHALVASYGGDIDNAAAVSAILAQTIAQAASSTTLVSSPNPSAPGAPVTFTATVAGSAPAGTVTFREGATDLCAAVAPLAQTATTSAAQCVNAALAAGSHAITAEFAGDAGNLPSSSSPLTQVVSGGSNTTVSGPSATGTGTITATIAGGCGFERWAFVDPPRPGGGRPSRTQFPHGLFEFTTDANCPRGGSITVSITYPQPLARGTRYWKFGPTLGARHPHWYTIPATLAGATATFTIVDGGLGDDDLLANGRIVDQGGPSAEDVAAMDEVAVPVLAGPASALLALLLVAVTWIARRRVEAATSRVEPPR